MAYEVHAHRVHEGLPVTRRPLKFFHKPSDTHYSERQAGKRVNGGRFT